MNHEVMELMKEKKIDVKDFNDANELYEELNYDGSLYEIIDAQIDVYYYDLRKWSVDNYEYIEEAMNMGLCEGVTDFHILIQCGQYQFYSECMWAIIEEIFKMRKGVA